MNITLKSAALAAAFAVALPASAFAMTINGQLDIAGGVNLAGSDFSATGNVDLFSSGFVIISTGDFSALAGTLASLTDIDFTAPGEIFSGGGFTFTATSFFDFQDTSLTKAFSALGQVTGNGFDSTESLLTFSAQPNGGLTEVSFSSTTFSPAPSAVPLPAAGFMLLGALAGFGALRRGKKA